MSTPKPVPASATLQEIHTHLLEIDPSLRSQTSQPAVLPPALLALEKINTTLVTANEAFLKQARSLYQALAQADLTSEAGKTLLADLKADLITQLQDLDDSSTVDGAGRRSYLTSTAGIEALAQQATLDVRDYLLSPAEQSMVDDCSRGPAFRPGMYSLTFSYQGKTVAFAGAFVLTRQASPVVDNLTSGQALGQVLLFTPNRGLEPFDSLSELDQSLKAMLARSAGREEWLRHLPVRYQALDVVDIWPLHLRPISSEPLFEHVYSALLDKRHQDIDLALSGVHNPKHDAAVLKSALDNAVQAALPDLTARLAFRQQQLLERSLYSSLPDWYRSAGPSAQDTLSGCIQAYNQARSTFLDLLGPAASPQDLATYQLTEYLDEELDMHDVDLQRLQITTRRTVANVGTYEQQRTLAQLSYWGLHTGDEQPGSDFLTQSSLAYDGGALQGRHAELNAQRVLEIIRELGRQPRLDFATLQKDMQVKPELKQAARELFDQRLVLLAWIARMRGDLSEADHRLFENLRAGTHPHLRAQTVLLHGAQLRDLWLLREEDADGQTRRLLLCTPGAPRAQQFMAFTRERACQTHIIGWADDTGQSKGQPLRDYVLEQCPVRFRPKMATFLSRLGFKPDAKEHEEVTFGPLCTHTACLDAMVTHAQSAAQDDYEYSTPLWYRSAPASDRTRLTSYAEDAAGAMSTYNARPDAEANFITFDAFVHQQAKLSLNALLGRRQNDVDPDTLYISAPWPLLGGMPAAVTYTRLFRDGYPDSVGFIDPKFSAAATFSGPAGIDLSGLTPEKVARSVTGIWIGQHYVDEVRTKLQSAHSPGYAERRNATLAINQLQMKYAALECCLRGHIARADLAWLERAIDSLGDTRVATRNTYRVHRLSIDGEWVIGAYLFSHGDNPVVLYTPNAPDGVAVREAKLFNCWLKKVEGVSDYLHGRVAVKARARIAEFLDTAYKGLPETINRTTPSPARHDPIARATPLTDLRHEFYNMVLQRKIDDVLATTVNRTDMIMGILWTCVELVTAIATIPFPVLSLGLGGLLAFKDAMLAISAYQQGDKGGALKHFIGYLANLGGAVLFDFRPALKGPFYSFPVRPLLKATRQAELIKAIEPRPPADLRPVLFDGNPFWVNNTPDPLGRHLLYRYDQVTGQVHSTARLVNQTADGRWVRSGVGGGGRRKYTLLHEEVESPLARYEIASEHGHTFRSALDADAMQAVVNHPDPVAAPAARDMLYGGMRSLHDRYTRQVTTLTQDAETFFTSPPTRQAPGDLPPLAPDASPSTVLATLFPLKKALIIGADNAGLSSKQILIEEMQALAAQGLKRVYIENLPADVFRTKLRIINGEAKGDLVHALKRVEDHLARVDQALGWSKDAPFTFRKLLLEAHKHKVAVDGVDASTSYHMEHVLKLSTGERFIPRASNVRNFYTHKMLATREANEGWIALVDHNRIGSTPQVPGLADLQQVVALRVEDVAPGQALNVLPDTSSAALSRGDYRLTLAQATKTVDAPGPSTVAPVASHYTAFDLPASFKNTLDDMVRTPSDLDTSSRFIQGGAYREAFVEFKATRERLDDTARAAFASYTPTARPDFADLAAVASEKAFIQQVYKTRLGLVIGEAHGDLSSKRFLKNYMALLKEQGVKTLYLEHLLTDLHQLELEAFETTLNMPDNLKRYLARQDAGHMRGYSGEDTYTQVVKAANKQGIRVRALDCTASYHLKGLATPNARTQLFNYFANEVIKADQASVGPHKWVALIGESHADLYHGVPGLARLQDAVSLTVRDVAPANARALHPGAWELVEGGAGARGVRAMRSDFKVDVGIVGKSAPLATTQPDRAWLRNVDDFLIEQPSTTQANVLHRSEHGEAVSTPIRIDDQGQFFVERWPSMKDKRFLTLEHLSGALKAEAHLSAASAMTVPSNRLRRVGEFLIERPLKGQANLFHYASTGEVIACPIKMDNVGQFYIENFAALDERRFLLVEELIDTLKSELSMTSVGTAPAPGARLRDSGEFLVERLPADQQQLLHRSRSGEIITTPIQVDGEGQLFIERWDDLKSSRFTSLGQLIFALKRRKGMLPAF